MNQTNSPPEPAGTPEPASPPERVAVVTGAGGGLAGAVARLLAEEGKYRLSLVDNRTDALEEVRAELAAAGADVLALNVDLGDPSEAESVISSTLERFGRVDALVNSAAVLRRCDLEEITPEEFDLVYHINARAPLLLTRAAMADMASRGWGRVVNVTSTGVYEGGFTMTSLLYESTKGALAVMTKMFANYGAANGILVNTVCPGGMRTRMLTEQTDPALIAKAEREMIPLRRLAEPSEVAEMVVWLLSDKNTYATGSEFDITGGVATH